jgi:hypothetical protein
LESRVPHPRRHERLYPLLLALIALAGQPHGKFLVIADAGEVCVLLPVPEQLADPRVLLGVVGGFGTGRIVGAEPSEELLAPTSALALIRRGTVSVLATAGLGGETGGVLAKRPFQVVSLVRD